MKGALDGANNGVHASASPLEGYAERANWLGIAPAEDQFGRQLLAVGISEELLAKWMQDPRVPIPGPGENSGAGASNSNADRERQKQHVSLFDLLEDLDVGPCIEVCRRVADGAVAWNGEY